MEAGAAGFLVKDGPVEDSPSPSARCCSGETVVDPALAAAALSAAQSADRPRRRTRCGLATGDRLLTSPRQLHPPSRPCATISSSAIGKTGTRNRMEAMRSARQQGWL
ncbi:hypothetical protein [Streptomyces sp. KL116D]|uniref:hypothetical protein n=1 Tax=Streptomyces sp. KL116D TaxID=3045152 RepID=UPI00355914B4